MQSPAENLKNASYGAVWVCGIPVRPHRMGVSTGVKTGVFKITRIFEIGGKIRVKFLYLHATARQVNLSAVDSRNIFQKEMELIKQLIQGTGRMCSLNMLPRDLGL